MSKPSASLAPDSSEKNIIKKNYNWMAIFMQSENVNIFHRLKLNSIVLFSLVGWFLAGWAAVRIYYKHHRHQIHSGRRMRKRKPAATNESHATTLRSSHNLLKIIYLF